MNMAFKKLLFLLILGFSSADQIKHYNGYTVYRLYPRSQSQLNYLQELDDTNSDLDFWKHPSAINSPVDVMIPPHLKHGFEKIFRKKNFEKIVMIPDVETLVEKQRREPVAERKDTGFEKIIDPDFYTQYQRLSSIHDFLRRLNNDNPSITQLENIGKSYEGRDLLLIKVGVGVSTNTKPIYFIDGGIHAREWISPATVLYFLESLIDGYNSNDPDTMKLLNAYDFYIIPVLNPDGYEYTHTNDRLWRKTRSINNGSDCIGTDANRNFNFLWGTVGSSSNPCSSTYRGRVPFSEIEIRTHANYITSLRPRIKIYLNIHCYGQVLIYAWAHISDSPPNYVDVSQRAINAINTLRNFYGTTFRQGTVTNLMYPAAGCASDYMYGQVGIKYSYTYELRDTGTFGFQLPPDQIVPPGIETSASFKRLGLDVINGL